MWIAQGTLWTGQVLAKPFGDGIAVIDREWEDTAGDPWLVVSQMAILAQTCVLHWVM